MLQEYIYNIYNIFFILTGFISNYKGLGLLSYFHHLCLLGLHHICVLCVVDRVHLQGRVQNDVREL